MAYAERLAARIRAQLIAREGSLEQKMFGGLCFMLQGNMAGVIRENLIVRVGPTAYAETLKRPHTAIFDFSGRPMSAGSRFYRPGLRAMRLWLSGFLKVLSSRCAYLRNEVDWLIFCLIDCCARFKLLK